MIVQIVCWTVPGKGMKNLNNFIEFDKSLIEGIIISRKSQFTMIVEVEGEEIICHCPTTGRMAILF